MKALNLMMLAVVLHFSACKKTDDTTINSISENTTSVSLEEKADLKFLIQEEKLARDVYAYAFAKYGNQIFSNINSSEQTHMDRVADLMLAYEIDNPVVGLNEGEFVNGDLQQLYLDLTSQVDVSLNEALAVGATIEDLDISDIESLYANTGNDDFISVYDALTCGSRNHMRSFVSNLEKNGESYEVQFLTQAELDEILNGSHESCGSN